MNQKIPFHELAERLSLATSISNDSAEVFIKNFFDLLSEAIVSGDTIRIKGLGSFAPVSIDGENSVEFTPDKEIADTLNAPFAPFEPVELNDEVTDEMLTETGESQSENVALTNEHTDDSHIQEANTVETAVLPIDESTVIKQPELHVEHIATPAPKNEENAEHLSIEVKESQPDAGTTHAQTSIQETEQPIANTPESAPADDGNQKELPMPVTNDDVPTTTITVAENEDTQLPATTVQTSKTAVRNALEEEPEEFVEHVANDSSSNNGGFGWGFLVGLLVGLALGACAVYLAIDYLFPYGRMERTEQVADNDIETVLTEEIILPEQTDTTSQLEEPAQPAEVITVAEPAKEEVEQPMATQPAPASSKPVHDTVRPGYSLTHMAKKHYGSKDFWVYIYEENKSKIKNPNKVQPGEVFVIPAPEKYGINASSEESIAKAKNKAGQILSKFK